MSNGRPSSAAIQRQREAAARRRTGAAARRRTAAGRRPAGAARRPRRGPASAYGRSAQQRLRRFRQGTLLAVAVTGLFLLLWGVPHEAPAQDTVPARVIIDTPAAAPPEQEEPPDPARAVEEATTTVRDLFREFLGALPAVAIAVLLLVVAAVLVRSARFVLRRLLGQWDRADAATAMAGVIIWLLAVGAALSIVAGDARALIGSVGLLGLALSWALQAPIESFAGWLLNSFKGYYRVGDRIGVGEVFGDVYRIDVLTTTVWEAGGPDKPVQGAQPTGALITFPNSEVLRANIVNYTRFFPYVWDEVVITITKDSDLEYAMRVIGDVARRVIGPSMATPVSTYRRLLEKEGLGLDIADEPQLFLTQADSWNEITIRYLVNARERRQWASRLMYEAEIELASPQHAERIRAAFPVRIISRAGNDTDSQGGTE